MIFAPAAQDRARLREAKFSFACQKRTRKAPAISTRWTHEKGAARPFQTPKGLSKPKNASRCAKTGCGSQRLLRYRSHPAGRGPNSSSLFPPLAAVVAVAPRGRGTGEPGRPTLDEQSFFILKTAVPCYRGQQLRNNILVKLLLISVAGHSFLRYIELSAGSMK